MKKFKVRKQIGKVKYVVSYHDGIKKHPDGSDFYDVEIFKSQKKMTLFVLELCNKGYINE